MRAANRAVVAAVSYQNMFELDGPARGTSLLGVRVLGPRGIPETEIAPGLRRAPSAEDRFANRSSMRRGEAAGRVR